MRRVGNLLIQIDAPVLPIVEAAAAPTASHSDLLSSLGICLGLAAVCALIASKLKQPPILAYLVAGIVIGPQIGFGWIGDPVTIEVISEIGLILLLFIIGAEIDLKKLRSSGKPVIVTGILQFVSCVLLGLGFFALLGFDLGRADAPGGRFGLAYMAVTTALSSTLIVVKLLYDKFELDTLPGQITLGVLVFQAIFVLALQPNLQHPDLVLLLASVAKGVLLVAVSLLATRYRKVHLKRSP